MDYGKMAYYKVEELERQMAEKYRENTQSGVRRAFYPQYNFEAGNYSFTTLGASGIVALVVKIKIRRLKTISGSVTLKVSALSAGAQDVGGNAGEQEYILLASVNVSGFADIILSPTSGLQATLVSVEVVAIGGEATLSGGLNNWSADYLADTSVAAISKEEQIYVTNVSDMLEKNVGRGHILDIVGIDNGFSLVYCDDLNNCWGVRLNINLVELSRRFLGEAADAVTVASNNGRLVVAILRGGVVISKTCDIDFGALSVGSELQVGLKAEDIRFVKHSSPPMLMVYCGGVAYLKFAATELSAASSFTVTGKFTYTKTV